MTLLIDNIGELVTNDDGEGPLGLRRNAAVVVDGDRIAWIGSAAQAPAADERLDAEGAAVLTGTGRAAQIGRPVAGPPPGWSPRPDGREPRPSRSRAGTG